MTLVQVLALFGVFVIGAIFGGWIGFVYLKWCLGHATVEAINVTRCANPECSEQHLQLRLRNAVPALGTCDVTFRVTSPEVLR